MSMGWSKDRSMQRLRSERVEELYHSWDLGKPRVPTPEGML